MGRGKVAYLLCIGCISPEHCLILKVKIVKLLLVHDTGDAWVQCITAGEAQDQCNLRNVPNLRRQCRVESDRARQVAASAHHEQSLLKKFQAHPLNAGMGGYTRNAKLRSTM